MFDAKTIREAIKYEARNNLTGKPAATLLAFGIDATDAELVRFAQLIGNITEGSERLAAPPMDSADLARSNID